MKLLTTAALVALLVGGAGGALTLVPAANADDAAAPATQAAPVLPGQDVARAGDDGIPGRPGMRGHWGQHGGWGGQGLRGNLLDIACGDRGAEALEIAFVRLNYAVKPTAEQAPLLDTLKTTALADQKTFAATCQTAMSGAQGKADILDRLQSRLTLDNARVAALSDVLPKFKAFYDSLTDDQKAKLQPPGVPRAAFNGMWGGRHGWHRGGPGHMGPQGAPNGAPGQNPGDANTAPDAPAPDAQS